MTLVWRGIGVSPFGSAWRMRANAGIPCEGGLIGVPGGKVRVSRIEWHVVYTFAWFFRPRLEPTVFVVEA